jgi:hypothetical protein
MDKWTPMLVLPNLHMRDAVECDFVAIVSPIDPHVSSVQFHAEVHSHFNQ